MQYAPLGRSGLAVGRLALGTMTFGEQNSEQEAFWQLDRALDAGVNLVDTAEMYPIPPNARTAGHTEEIVGRWMRARGNRTRVVLATKISGPAETVAHIRGGDLALGRRQIRDAIEGSLRRLKTDAIDLYQIHWPDRSTNMFGRRGYVHDPDDTYTPLAETLHALDDEIRAGKVRLVGVSNETPWGLMTYLAAAERDGLPRPVSIQNPYSLLNRLFEVGLAEVAMREDCGLLAYSPLGFGTLSGKYLDGRRPPEARLTRFPHYRRYTGRRAVAATEAYVTLARRYGLDPAQMALAYVISRPFTTAAIVGATTAEQLERNLGAAELALDGEIVDAIERLHESSPNPAP